MKDIMNLPFFKQFKFVSLFAYQMQHSKKIKKLSFQLAIPLNIEVFAIQPDLVAWGVALRLDTFVIG